MSKYIYIYTNSLSTELCNDIIKQFNHDKHLCHIGATSRGVNKYFKDSLDLNILDHDNEWNKFKPVLIKELEKHCRIYYQKNNTDISSFDVNTMQIQRYDKSVGHFHRHNDELITSTISRKMVFMWYLNDVEEGGETSFPDYYIKVKPEAGKLVIFPATWTYPHCAEIPISSDKYIITGWCVRPHSDYQVCSKSLMPTQ
jgi:prolyl 4-hydroxylase